MNAIPFVIKHSAYVELLGNSLNRPSLNYDVAFLKNKNLNFSLRIGIFYWKEGSGFSRDFDTIVNPFNGQVYFKYINYTSPYVLNIPVEFSYVTGLKNFFEIGAGLTYSYNSIAPYGKDYFYDKGGMYAKRNFLHSLIFIPRIGYRLEKPKGFFMRASISSLIHLYEFKKEELGASEKANKLVGLILLGYIPFPTISLGYTFK